MLRGAEEREQRRRVDGAIVLGSGLANHRCGVMIEIEPRARAVDGIEDLLGEIPVDRLTLDDLVASRVEVGGRADHDRPERRQLALGGYSARGGIGGAERRVSCARVVGSMIECGEERRYFRAGSGRRP